jgi:TonB-linked SusC/RagA family outer membrane protein
MTCAWIRRSLHFTSALASLALFTSVAWSQSMVFAGKVTSQGQPLGGASVGLLDIGAGAITDVDGKYSFRVDVSKARGRTLNLTARFIGFKPKMAPVVIAAGRLDKDFDLEKDVLNLEQIVVTGVSGATSQRNTAFAVGVVDATQLQEAPAVSPLGSLEGKVAGASIVTTSGQPGTEPMIRLRAATSLTGTSNPLLIVDGTITRLGMADINSEDIERIEVIKGAAASSLYGSDAANGVVQIFTKRGASLAEGQTTLTVRNEYGDSYLPRKLATNQSNDYVEDPATHQFILDGTGNRVEKPDHISNNPYPVTYDQFDQIFKTGQSYTNYVSIGQRRGSTNFNASFQNTRDPGVVAILKGFSRQNFRVNLDQSFGDKLDLSVGAFYGASTADQQPEGSGSVFFGLRFLEPNINLLAKNPDGSPYLANIYQSPSSGNVTNPLYYLNTREIFADRTRFTGTSKLRYRPFDWLTAEGNVNYDQSNQLYKSLTPLGFLTGSHGVPSQGSLYEQQLNSNSNNVGATLTATKAWSWITNTTKLAWIFEDETDGALSVNALALAVPKVSEFSAYSTGSPVLPGSSTQITRNMDSFAVTTFTIKDRYIFDALIRRDESSLFGAARRGADYQRLSFAYRLSQDLRIKGVDEFKLRASYGTAGLRPPWAAQYETLVASGGSLTKTTLGNADLKPAYSREQEFGFNLNFLRNYTLDYSYSNKVTSDQIMQVPVSSATGYASEWVNAATLAGQTHELSFGAVLASKKDFFWRLNISADRTRQQITKLNVAPFLIGPPGIPGMFDIRAGSDFGIIFGEKWIRNAQQLQQTIQSGALGGSPSDYVVNEEGYYVSKSTFHTKNEVPLKASLANGTTFQPIGNVNADFNSSLNTNLQYKAFSLNAVFTWVKGGNIYNMTRQWGGWIDSRDPAYDQRGKPALQQKPVTYYQVFYDGITPNDYFVEDGSFIRLRELSVNWQVPKSFVTGLKLGGIESARIGIVGRNLWTSTKYSGYDPDVSNTGNGFSPFLQRVDYFTYPAYRTITVMLELGY